MLIRRRVQDGAVLRVYESEKGPCLLEERKLSEAGKMGEPGYNIEDKVVVLSDKEVEEQGSQNSIGGKEKAYFGSDYRQQAGKVVQWIPRAGSAMLHEVQAWDVGNQSMFRLGEQVEFVDKSGLVLKGTVCGETSGDGSIGRAQVLLDFWQSDQGEGITGCDTARFLGGHVEATVHQQFGRLAGVQSLPVKVRAPSRHRVEGRVKSGAVSPTSREPYGLGSLGQGADSVCDVQPSTSARVECLEEELLDYEEEVDEQVTPVSRGVVKEMPRTISKVVWGDHFGSRRRDTVTGSLPRGEGAISGLVGFGGERVDFGDGMRKDGENVCGVTKVLRKDGLDVSIQAGTSALTEVKGNNVTKYGIIRLWLQFALPLDNLVHKLKWTGRERKNLNLCEAHALSLFQIL
ncbi:hypothetical protein NDU88_004138 [Pleurodeles waltl]|uniref:Uncharacterized protein n=1 Tax=Pleurodeles waltl TaxID=8319 RepID=A0AAV7UEQ4_PLEWA|nr:hypothetical protein NDU88_004138 [Pleurodeles waltl]